MYGFLRLIDPLVRLGWRGYGLGNVCELVVTGRRTGRARRATLGLLVANGSWYLGHPNGEAAWTRNLASSGRADLIRSWPRAIPVVASRLAVGEERTQAIHATNQHPFPGNVVYRLARRHVLATGVYFGIEPVSASAADQSTSA